MSQNYAKPQLDFVRDAEGSFTSWSHYSRAWSFMLRRGFDKCNGLHTDFNQRCFRATFNWTTERGFVRFERKTI